MTKLKKDRHGASLDGLLDTWPSEGAERHERSGLAEIGLDLQPAPAPAPAPGLTPVVGRVDVWSYPKGPYEVDKATPWDDYEYPSIASPPELPPIAKTERLAMDWLASKLPKAAPWVRAKGRQPRRDPLPPDRQLPAALTTLSALGADPAEPGLSSGVGIADALATDEGQLKRGILTATPLQLLDDYLKRCGIRYFSAHEITWHKWRDFEGVERLRLTPSGLRIASWSYVFDKVPPHHWVWLILPRYVVPDPSTWPNIIPVLRVLDRFRHWLGEPVRGISGYRQPMYNGVIKGADDSRHKSFQAMDFAFGPRGTFIDAELFKRWFAHLYRRGADGVGLYDDFVHLDIGTRPQGKSKNWDKRSDNNPYKGR